jgi:hypothetical protein
MFRVSFLPPKPLLVCDSLGEFGDGGLLLGLSNIRSLHCLLSKPCLVAGFKVEAGSCWTASVGSLLVVMQDIDEEEAHRCSFRVSYLPTRPSLVCSCSGEFEDDGLLLGLSNIESLLPKPGLLAGLMLEAAISVVGSLFLVLHSRSPSQRFFLSFVSFFKNVGAWKSFIPIACRFMFSRLSEGSLDASLTMDTLATSTLLGLGNIVSLLPKPGLLTGLMLEAAISVVGSLFLVLHSRSPSQRFFLSFVSFFKNVGAWKSFIPIARRFMFSRLSEGNLEASSTMDTLATSTLPTTPARGSARKGEWLLLVSIEVFMFSRLSECDFEASWTTDTLAISTLSITPGR